MFSISLRSSSERSNSAAGAVPSIWSGLRAPTIATSTFGLARVQAIASWATVPLLGEPLQLLDRFEVFAEVLALEELRERLQLVEGELRRREDDQVCATVLGVVAGVQLLYVPVCDR